MFCSNKVGVVHSILVIANLCPDAIGYPVHAARTALMRFGLDSLIEIHNCENWHFTDEIDGDSIEAGGLNSLLSIFPNPASVEVTFEHDLESTDQVRIKVYDTMGNLKYNELFSESSRALIWNTTYEISGLYYVVLMQDDIVVESKSLAIIH